MSNDEITTRAIAPWFGSGRMIAKAVGQELAGCRWVGIPFCGGLSELTEIDAPTIVANDLHRDVVNLATCIADPESYRVLVRMLRRLPFHPDVLLQAHEFCQTIGPKQGERDVIAAHHYFVCCWMGRSAAGGTPQEFSGGLSRRWNANGGDSNTRYRSALRSLAGWSRVMRRCNFDCMDAFDFLEKCQDKPGHGIYVDAPWPEDGDNYRHKFTESNHRKLAAMLMQYGTARVVVRFGDHPLIREIYPEDRWTWRRMTGRTQANKDKAEVLIINGPSRSNEGVMFE